MRKRYSTHLPAVALSAGLLGLALLAGSLGASLSRDAETLAADETSNRADRAEAVSTRPGNRNARHMLRMPYFSFARSLRPGG